MDDKKNIDTKKSISKEPISKEKKKPNFSKKKKIKKIGRATGRERE